MTDETIKIDFLFCQVFIRPVNMASSSMETLTDWCFVCIGKYLDIGTSYDLLRTTLMLTTEHKRVIFIPNDDFILAKFALSDWTICVVWYADTLTPEGIGYKKNNTQIVHWLHWHRNGQIASKGDRKSNYKTGYWRYWRDTGQLTSEGSYNEASDLHGCWQYWYQTGQLKFKYNFKDGRAEGHWQQWYPTGQSYSEGYYKNDNQNGNWRYWHSTGQLRAEGSYENGHKIGHWQYWTDDGQITVEEDYANGVLVE